MTNSTRSQDIASKRVILTLPGIDAVKVRRGELYRRVNDNSLTMNLYYPPHAAAATPAVVLVTGFADAGARLRLGCTFNEMGSFVSWAQLIALTGIVAITYTNQDPAGDARAVLTHMREHAHELGIDQSRIGLWACSGHAANALSLLMSSSGASATCAALLYPYTFDFNGSSGVANAARQFGFVTVSAGHTIDDLPPNVPIFIARAGQDRMPGLNDALDRFVASALRTNRPITCVNQPDAPHAFDLFDDTDRSRAIVQQTLRFLQSELLGASQGS